MTTNAAENATAGVPVVRGLEWQVDFAHTNLGLFYFVSRYPECAVLEKNEGSMSLKSAWATVEDAKAEAQADYERRVRNILNPDFLSELDTARAEIERLREALTFYQDGFTFITDKRRPGLAWVPTETLLDDCGNIARIALSADPVAPSALTAAQARIAELETALLPFVLAEPTNIYSGDIEDPDAEAETLFTENQFRFAREVFAKPATLSPAVKEPK